MGRQRPRRSPPLGIPLGKQVGRYYGARSIAFRCPKLLGGGGGLHVVILQGRDLSTRATLPICSSRRFAPSRSHSANPCERRKSTSVVIGQTNIRPDAALSVWLCLKHPPFLADTPNQPARAFIVSWRASFRLRNRRNIWMNALGGVRNRLPLPRGPRGGITISGDLTERGLGDFPAPYVCDLKGFNFLRAPGQALVPRGFQFARCLFEGRRRYGVTTSPQLHRPPTINRLSSTYVIALRIVPDRGLQRYLLRPVQMYRGRVVSRGMMP